MMTVTFFLQRVLEILRHTGAPKGFSVRLHKEWLKSCILDKQTMPKMFVRRYKQKHWNFNPDLQWVCLGTIWKTNARFPQVSNVFYNFIVEIIIAIIFWIQIFYLRRGMWTCYLLVACWAVISFDLHQMLHCYPAVCDFRTSTLHRSADCRIQI